MFEEDFTAVRVFTPIIQLDPHLAWQSGRGVGLSLSRRGSIVWCGVADPQWSWNQDKGSCPCADATTADLSRTRALSLPPVSSHSSWCHVLP